MPKFLIECKLPAERKASLGKLKAKRGKTDWRHGLVAGDRIFCLYHAPSEKVLRTQVSRGGIKIARVSKVMSIIDPTKLAAIIDPTKF